jgi:hypothetical protein
MGFYVDQGREVCVQPSYWWIYMKIYLNKSDFNYNISSLLYPTYVEPPHNGALRYALLGLYLNPALVFSE